MKKLLICLLCFGFLFVMVSGSAMAATEQEKRDAIDAGLAYLASQQSLVDGHWEFGGTDYDMAATGSSLLAFLEEKPNWGTNAAAYQAVVDSGLNYLLSNAQLYGITSTGQAGNPDGDGNGYGVKFLLGGNNDRDTYVAGIVLPAIASSGTPDKLVTVGMLAGRTDGSGPEGQWTYRDVVQNTIDYFAFGQNEGASPGPRGGWRYYANYGSSDQSTTQWPIIAGLFASKMGVSLPGYVSSELALWTNYIQNAAGYAGYTSPTFAYGEMNETGALLLMQDYLNWPTGDARVQSALSYINANWKWTASSFDGNFGNPYAMWAIYKGLEVTIGLDDMTKITNLHTDPGDIDNPNHGWNWWEDYCEYLVNSQNEAGNWNGYYYWGSPLATPWFINILAATRIPDGPEPAFMLLLGSGLVGMGAFKRMRRMK